MTNNRHRNLNTEKIFANLMIKKDKDLVNDIVDISCDVCGENTFRNSHICNRCKRELKGVEHLLKVGNGKSAALIIDSLIKWNKKY